MVQVLSASLGVALIVNFVPIFQRNINGMDHVENMRTYLATGSLLAWEAGHVGYGGPTLILHSNIPPSRCIAEL